MSEYFRLLGRLVESCGDGHDHAHGRYLYARLPVLLGQDLARPSAAGPTRA